jgi:hypothetical protein
MFWTVAPVNSCTPYGNKWTNSSYGRTTPFASASLINGPGPYWRDGGIGGHGENCDDCHDPRCYRWNDYGEVQPSACNQKIGYPDTAAQSSVGPLSVSYIYNPTHEVSLQILGTGPLGSGLFNDFSNSNHTVKQYSVMP